jgi:hypothetical protein
MPALSHDLIVLLDKAMRFRASDAAKGSCVDQVLRDWLVSDLEVGSTVWVDSADAAVLACTAVAKNGIGR